MVAVAAERGVRIQRLAATPCCFTATRQIRSAAVRGRRSASSSFITFADLQRCGAKDPTRAALNPGCNEVDRQLHEWANHNDQGIATIIAGHTHRAVFENLSLTERRYLESKIKTDGVKIKHQPDGSYYNTGSCVHPLSITGIEITFEGSHGPRLCLVEWGQATEGHAVTIQGRNYHEDKTSYRRRSDQNRNGRRS